MANKKDMRDFLERLFKDRPKERERILKALEDERFDYNDWMREAGYTQEQRLTVLNFTTDVMHFTLKRLQKKPVPKWTANDWEEHERFQWEATDIFRELLKGYFTDEQVQEIAEAWEHDRYVHHSITDGNGRIHHCRFCKEVAH